MRAFRKFLASIGALIMLTQACWSASDVKTPEMIQSIISGVVTKDNSKFKSYVDNPTMKNLINYRYQKAGPATKNITSIGRAEEIYVRLFNGNNWNIINVIARHENGQSRWRFYQERSGGIIVRADLLDYIYRKSKVALENKPAPISVASSVGQPPATPSTDTAIIVKGAENNISLSQKDTMSSGIIGGLMSPTIVREINKRDNKESSPFKGSPSVPANAPYLGSSLQSKENFEFISPEPKNNFLGSVVKKVSSSGDIYFENIVEVPFVTTRKRDTSASSIYFNGDRGRKNVYGFARVRIPKNHELGRLEVPSSYGFYDVTFYNETPDENKHFTIKSVFDVSAADFDDYIRKKSSKDALIFVHGFNTDFRSAVYRTAQIAWDLNPSGPVFLFSWPSNGQTTDYLYDKDSAYGARDSFIELLRHLKVDLNIENVSVIAHSMGNIVVLDALAGHSKTRDPFSISNLIMAAPDIDKDQFIEMVPQAKKVVSKMTLYASSSDRALKISKMLARGIARAGDISGDAPIMLPEIESIDVTNVGDEFLGLNHNTFASTKSVMNDIGLLLKGMASPRLSEVRGMPLNVPPPQYFRFMR